MATGELQPQPEPESKYNDIPTENLALVDRIPAQRLEMPVGTYALIPCDQKQFLELLRTGFVQSNMDEDQVAIVPTAAFLDSYQEHQYNKDIDAIIGDFLDDPEGLAGEYLRIAISQNNRDEEENDDDEWYDEADFENEDYDEESEDPNDNQEFQYPSEEGFLLCLDHSLLFSVKETADSLIQNITVNEGVLALPAGQIPISAIFSVITLGDSAQTLMEELRAESSKRKTGNSSEQPPTEQ